MQPKITHPVVSNLCPWQAYGSAHGSAHGRPEGMQTPETRVHASCLSSSPNKHEVSGRIRLACCPLCSFSVITVYTRDKCLFKFRYENVLRFLKYPRVLHLLKILFFEGGINSQPSMLVNACFASTEGGKRPPVQDQPGSHSETRLPWAEDVEHLHNTCKVLDYSSSIICTKYLFLIWLINKKIQGWWLTTVVEYLYSKCWFYHQYKVKNKN